MLAETDALHGTLSGPATRALCARAWRLFGDGRFERLARISNGHLYNLRRSTTYARRRGATPQPTRPASVAIGERRRPQPFGRPGWVRVDTVHHRPCFFPREQVDAKGRVRKRYRHADVMTPCEKLQSLPDAAACLKPGTTFDQLDAVATARSDNEAARALSQARERLFRSLDPAA